MGLPSSVPTLVHTRGLVVAQVLDFSGLAWGEAEACQLAEALPHFASLRSLDASHNPLGPAGGVALGVALGRPVGDGSEAAVGDGSEAARVPAHSFPSSLESLRLSECDLGASGGRALAEALRSCRQLTMLDLSINVTDQRLGEGAAFGVAMAAALRGCPSLTSVCLSSNNIGDGESGLLPAKAVAIAPASASAPSGPASASAPATPSAGARFGEGAAVLYLGRRMVVSQAADASGELRVRPAEQDRSGAAALAAALAASPALVSCDLAENQLSGCCHIIAEALAARAGAPAGMALSTLDMRENYCEREEEEALRSAVEAWSGGQTALEL